MEQKVWDGIMITSQKYLRTALLLHLSMGTERRFLFRYQKSNKKITLQLKNGSLLIMQRKIQSFWKHQLPKMKKVQSPRINLTFRMITPQY